MVVTTIQKQIEGLAGGPEKKSVALRQGRGEISIYMEGWPSRCTVRLPCFEEFAEATKGGDLKGIALLHDKIRATYLVAVYGCFDETCCHFEQWVKTISHIILYSGL